VKEKFTANVNEAPDLSLALAFESHRAPQRGEQNESESQARALKAGKGDGAGRPSFSPRESENDSFRHGRASSRPSTSFLLSLPQNVDARDKARA
jgi:hypothetical protein